MRRSASQSLAARLLPIGALGALVVVVLLARGAFVAPTQGSGKIETESSASEATELSATRDSSIQSDADPASATSRAAVARNGVALDATIPDAYSRALEPDGRPRLIGRVVDLDGNALPGARVLAASMWEPPIPLETPGFIGPKVPVVRTETDADGFFRIDEGLRAGWYLTVCVLNPPFAPWRASTEWFNFETPTDLGDIQLEPGVELRGRVRDERGEPVADARVLLAIERGVAGVVEDFPGAGAPLGRSNADGRFVASGLSFGPWVLLIDAPGFMVARLSGTATLETSPADDLVVQLQRGAAITGALRGRPPEAAETLLVEARPLSSKGTRMDSARARARRAVIRENGRFELLGLDPNLEFRLTVARGAIDGPTEWIAAVEPREARPGESGVQLEWIGPTGFCARMIDGATGEPVEQALLLTQHEEGWFYVVRGPNGEHPGTEHPNGNVLFDQLASKRKDSTFALKIESGGYEDRVVEFELERGRIVDLGDIELSAGAGVRVRAIDGVTQLPASGANVYLSNDPSNYLETSIRLGRTESGDWMQFARTDGDGVALLPEVSGERVRLAVEAPLRAIAWVELGALDLDEILDVEVELQPGAQLDVHLTDSHGSPVVDAVVEAKRPDSEHFAHDAMNTVAGGVAIFENLAPGDWVFRQRLERRSWRSDDYDNEASWRPVTLQEGERAELHLVGHALRRVSGVLRDRAGPVVGARVYVEPVDPREGKFPAHDKKGNFVGYQVRSQANGTFEMRNIVDGEYYLIVEHEARALNARRHLMLDRDVSDIDWVLPSCGLEGQVVDAKGRGIADVNVRVRALAHGYSAGRVGLRLELTATGVPRAVPGDRRLDEVRTDSDGRFRLLGLPEGVEFALELSGRFVVAREIRVGALGPDESRYVEALLERAGVIAFDAPTFEQQGWRIDAIGPAGMPEHEASDLRSFDWAKELEMRGCRAGTWVLQTFRVTDDSSQMLETATLDVVAGEVTRAQF